MINLFIDGLKINDANVIIEVLQSLTTILQLDGACDLRGEDSFAYKLETAGGLDELEKL